MAMIDFFLNAYRDKDTVNIVLEIIAFFFGIVSVCYAKKESILVYPTGLVATIISVYLLFTVQYFADMVLNIYFSMGSIYGWYNWSRKVDNLHIVTISRTSAIEKLAGIVFFLLTIIVAYVIYCLFGYKIKPENYIDIITSALFSIGMWYMAIKKIENWILWIIGDLISVPLYAYRDLWILSLQYVVFTILAILAYMEWSSILNRQKALQNSCS